MARGALAEWLGKGLQNLLHRFKSGTRLQANLTNVAIVGANDPIFARSIF